MARNPGINESYYVNRLTAGHGYIGAADRRGIQKTVNPLVIAADCADFFEQLINIAGNHGIFDPADNLAFLNLET